MTMIYHGNYKSIVHEDILQKIFNTPGEVRPEAQDYTDHEHPDWDNIELIGARWSFYYDKEIGINKISLPIPYSGTINWWFCKLLPTCCLPMHEDAFKKDQGAIRRLWIPYQDYIPGHIFIYKDSLIKDYKAGDIFEFDDPFAMHGGGNLTYIPKVTLQVSIHET